MSWQDIHLPFCLVNQDAFGKMKKGHGSGSEIRWGKGGSVVIMVLAISAQCPAGDFFAGNPARQVQKGRVSGIVAGFREKIFFRLAPEYGRAAGKVIVQLGAGKPKKYGRELSSSATDARKRSAKCASAHEQADDKADAVLLGRYAQEITKPAYPTTWLVSPLASPESV